MKKIWVFLSILLISNNIFAESAVNGPGNCLYFGGDATTEYVDCGFVVDPGTLSALTVEVWVNISSLSGASYNRVISQDYISSEDTGLGWLNILTTGEVYSRLSGSLQSTSSAISVGEWTHVAMVWNGSTLRFYFNGVLDGSIYSFSSIVSSDNDLYLGWQGRYNNTYFHGGMDEVRIWNTARSAQQIRDNMYRALSGSESGLLAYYKFDQSSGTTLTDASGNGHNGTLNNMDDGNWTDSEAFITWLGTSSSDWSTEANWSDGIPGSGDNVGIFKWDGNSEVSISGDPNVKNLVISSSSSPTLESGIMVSGNLILNSDMDLNGQTVTIGSNGTLREYNGVFYGTSGSITTTRSLSNISSQDVGGLGAVITTSANMGETSITRHHAQANNIVAGSILRQYNISPGMNTGLNATLAFNYFSTELNSLDESILRLFKSIDSGTNWTNQHGKVDTGANTVTLSGIDGFSLWTLSEDIAPVTQAVSTTFSNTSNTSTTVDWTRGDGEYCAVFIAVASSGTAGPVDATTYSANTIFGSGDQIASSGWYCVYNGTGTSVSVSGLSASTTYRVHVCEYNGNTGQELYLIASGTENPANVTTNDGSLPVELSSFSAQSEGKTIVLEWVTESETDNLGFILERSLDNQTWMTISSYKTHTALWGQGNTSSRTEYTFTDKTVAAEADYTYRLSEVNIEGERNVIASTSVNIDALPVTTQLFAAYPNPFNPTTTVAYQLAKEERVEISVYNTLGSFIKTLYSSNQPAGSYQVSWDATNENGSKVPSGAYLIRMQTDKVTQTQKVLLVK